MFCVTPRKFCDVENPVKNVLFSATILHVLSRNPTSIPVKTVLVEYFLGGTAMKIVAVRCKQDNVGSTIWYVVLKNCKTYYK